MKQGQDKRRHRPMKNKAAVAMGKLGGKARAKSLSPARRREIASKAGLAASKLREKALGLSRAVESN